MDTMTIQPALRGQRCWCHRAAVVSRITKDTISHYCARHWALWWALTLRANQPPLLVSEKRQRVTGYV